MSQVSLSQLDYSVIGFSKTDGGIQRFEESSGGADVETEWSKTMVHDADEGDGEAAAAAKVEAAGENPAEEEGGEELQQSVQASQYCERRADVIDGVQQWMTEASRMIAMFPLKRSADRKRRTIDFVNKTKVILRKTKPIREEENEEDAAWLEAWVSELPEVPAASAVAIVKVGAVAESPLRRVLTRAQLAITGKKDLASNSIRHSTPEATTKEKTEKTKKGGKGKTRKEKAKEVTPLDLVEKVTEEKVEEEVVEGPVTATALPHNNTVDWAIKHDSNMMALIDMARSSRDKKKEETRKAVEEEERQKKQRE